MSSTDTPILEMRLLDLQKEYASHEQDVSIMIGYGMEPERTREDIAREYGEALREFLTT